MGSYLLNKSIWSVCIAQYKKYVIHLCTTYFYFVLFYIAGYIAGYISGFYFSIFFLLFCPIVIFSGVFIVYFI